jgi:hypothetical protein
VEQRLPAGMMVGNMTVLTQACWDEFIATGTTINAAFAEARAKAPLNASDFSERVLSEYLQITACIESTDVECARNAAMFWRKGNPSSRTPHPDRVIRDCRLAPGIGNRLAAVLGRSAKYLAVIEEPARVRVRFCRPSRIRVGVLNCLDSAKSTVSSTDWNDENSAFHAISHLSECLRFSPGDSAIRAFLSDAESCLKQIRERKQAEKEAAAKTRRSEIKACLDSGERLSTPERFGDDAVEPLFAALEEQVQARGWSDARVTCRLLIVLDVAYRLKAALSRLISRTFNWKQHAELKQLLDEFQSSVENREKFLRDWRREREGEVLDKRVAPIFDHDGRNEWLLALKNSIQSENDACIFLTAAIMNLQPSSTILS